MTERVRTKIKGFEIRAAVIEDVPLIFSFIRELAEYEKLLDDVVATEEGLRQTLFGDRPSAEVIIGEWNSKAVAFALFFHNYSTFLGKPGLYLEDLYVKPEVRGQGLGRVILSYLAKVAVQRNCGRFEWWVLDWNEPAIHFYESIGAVPMSEWTVQRVTGPALQSLADKFVELNSKY